jgi:hypothetical protein
MCAISGWCSCHHLQFPFAGSLYQVPTFVDYVHPVWTGQGRREHPTCNKMKEG